MQLKSLIMLNDEDERLIVNDYLTSLGFDIYSAKDHPSAYDFWVKQEPQLIIIDQHFDLSSGQEFVKKIRRNEFDHHTYIIMIQENDERSIELSNECGSDDFMAQPVTYFELKRRIYTALRTITLFEQNLIVYALTRVIEARDRGIQGHLSRVGILSKILMDGLEDRYEFKDIITRHFKEDLTVACQLHDIGKIGIADIILKKPGEYTKEEFALMKQHVIIGYEIVKSIQQKYPRARFFNMALEITRHHHERFDGTGYPDGLKGYDIPLSARIVGLADFYDALTTKRVYKRKYSHEEAKKMIIDKRGSHFDPVLVDVFLENEESFKNISEGHGDLRI